MPHPTVEGSEDKHADETDDAKIARETELWERLNVRAHLRELEPVNWACPLPSHLGRRGKNSGPSEVWEVRRD